MYHVRILPTELIFLQLLLIFQQFAKMDKTYRTGTGRLVVPFLPPLAQYQFFEGVYRDGEGIELSGFRLLRDCHVPFGQVGLAEFVRMSSTGGEKEGDVADGAVVGATRWGRCGIGGGY